MKKLLAVIAGITLLTPQVMLADFVPSDEDENASNTFILDADDTGGDVTLQFGASLAEFLKWNSSTLSFDLSDETLTLDASNTGAGANVSIIANQGSDNDGEIRYNATTNQWEYSNDGGSFQAIGSGGGGTVATDLPVVQVRQAGGYTLSATTWADITFDTTDIENGATILEHNNTNTDRIDIKEDGIYMITYSLNVDDAAATGTWDSRVRVNDTTVLNGSVETNSNYQGEYVATAVTFYASLSTNDYITLQAQRTSANNLTSQADPVMTITKMEGIKGDQGDQGIQGVQGDQGIQGIQGEQGPQGIPGSGSTVTISEEGTTIANTPHATLNFIGGSVTATDAGSGVANITVSSSGADFEGVYGTDVGNNLVTSDGIFTINTGTNDFVVDSNDWNVTAAGALDAASISSTGTVNFSGATSTRIHEAASDPGTCTEGQLFYNTTDNYLKVCTTLNTWTAQGRRVPDMNAFTDTTQDTSTNNDTTNYWDGTQPNITPTSANSEILVMVSVAMDPNTAANRSVVMRVERAIGGTPTCGSSTKVGDELGMFNTENDDTNTSAIYVDTPGTTSNVVYTLCSSSDSADVSGLITEIDFTLYEINDAADLAEIYASKDASLLPGEIVSLDSSLIAGVQRSETTYDSKVLGIVSTKPAELIGDTNGEGVTGVPVALSGRVPVKVSTENGPIKPGDLLTTSSIPGVAMKATEPGYIIGRAFNGYSGKDVGLILLFVGTHYADPRTTW